MRLADALSIPARYFASASAANKFRASVRKKCARTLGARRREIPILGGGGVLSKIGRFPSPCPRQPSPDIDAAMPDKRMVSPLLSTPSAQQTRHPLTLTGRNVAPLVASRDQIPCPKRAILASLHTHSTTLIMISRPSLPVTSRRPNSCGKRWRMIRCAAGVSYCFSSISSPRRM